VAEAGSFAQVPQASAPDAACEAQPGWLHEGRDTARGVPVPAAARAGRLGRRNAAKGRAMAGKAGRGGPWKRAGGEGGARARRGERSLRWRAQ